MASRAGSMERTTKRRPVRRVSFPVLALTVARIGEACVPGEGTHVEAPEQELIRAPVPVVLTPDLFAAAEQAHQAEAGGQGGQGCRLRDGGVSS